MDENSLQIISFTGEGFKPLMAFSTWRVAVLNYLDEIHPENNTQMERHCMTDEVFVLTKGRAVLLIGGSGPRVEAVEPQVMEIGVVYNVRQNAWHAVLLSRDASILLVEERDTEEANSEYCQMTADQHRQVVELGRLHQLP